MQERIGGQPGVEARKPPAEIMKASKNLGPVVRFGVFEVAFESRELRKQGMRIQLEEKPFHILELLIQSAGRVVRRETLCEKLWPNTHVAFDHSLNTAVNKLRAVLGDVAQNPRFIETRPRLGYRFVAPVEPQAGYGTPLGVRAPNASGKPPDSAAEGQTRPPVKATPVRGSSPRLQAPAPPLQAKSCQTAR